MQPDGSRNARIFHAALLALPLVLLAGCFSNAAPSGFPPPGHVAPGYGPPGYMPPQALNGPAPIFISNPALIPNMDRDLVWNNLVDVVDDYFKVEREDRVKLIGDVLTEGTLTTYPRTGSTILEPWNKDTVTPYERLESTLQSIRRRAIIRVAPAEGGFTVEVTVFKEQEDVTRPEVPSAGKNNLRNDNALQRYTNPVGGQPGTIGWYLLGRDTALEQTILGQLQARFGAPPVGVAY